MIACATCILQDTVLHIKMGLQYIGASSSFWKYLTLIFPRNCMDNRFVRRICLKERYAIKIMYTKQGQFPKEFNK